VGGAAAVDVSPWPPPNADDRERRTWTTFDSRPRAYVHSVSNPTSVVWHITRLTGLRYVETGTIRCPLGAGIRPLNTCRWRCPKARGISLRLVFSPHG